MENFFQILWPSQNIRTLIEKMGHLDYLASHNSAKTIMKFHLTFYEPTISLNISEVFIEDQDLTEFFPL